MTSKRLSSLVLLTVLISWPVCSYSSDFVFYCAPWKEIKNKKTFKNKKSLNEAILNIQSLREKFWKDVKVTGDDKTYNPELDKAGRVADFFELGELMMRDALEREESCGGHFREEYQTQEGEALRDDENYTFASTWEFKGIDKPPILHKEDLNFETVTPTQRSYK